MRCGDYRHALVSDHFSEEAEDRLGVVGVEFTSRFVSEDNVRPHSDGSGDGYALLLTAGEFVWAMPGASRKADHLKGIVGAFGAFACGKAGDTHGEFDVFVSG